MTEIRSRVIKQTILLHTAGVVLSTTLFIFSFSATFNWLYVRYMSEDSYYSHGFLIPFISLYLIWLKKDQLRSPEPIISIWGILILIFGLLMHAVGMVLYIFSLSGFSIFFYIWGACYLVIGKNNTRVILFPIVYLLFMFPLPIALINAIAFPLKMLVAKVGVDFVRLLNIPIFREGFNIIIPAGNLLVGNPCSGLRSLIAFMALGSLFAYLSDLSLKRKWVLFLLSIPIAVFSNIVRVPMLILISHFWGLEAGSPESIWHNASGVFMFIIGLILMYYAGNILRWKAPGINT